MDDTKLNLNKLEKNTITRKQAVELFGSDAMRKRFLDKGSLTSKQLTSLKRAMETYFDKVTVVKSKKDKRATEYKLGNLLLPNGTPAKKENDRSIGKLQRYAKGIDLLLISAIMLDKEKLDGKSYTISTWMKELGFTSEEYYQDSKKILYSNSNQSKVVKDVIDKLTERKIIDTESGNSINTNMLSDYFKSNQLSSKFMESLERLERARIIVTMDTYKAKLLNKDEYVTLSEKQLDAIIEGEIKIRRKNKTEAKKAELIKEFYKNIAYTDSEGNEKFLSIEYYFKTKFIKICATKTKIQQYIKKSNKEVLQSYVDDKSSLLQEEIEYLKQEKKRRILNVISKRKEKECKTEQDFIEQEKEKIKYIGREEQKIKSLDRKLQELEVYKYLYIKAFENLEEYYDRNLFNRLLYSDKN